MNELEVIILAAGKGKRMNPNTNEPVGTRINSDLPKPLYTVGGETSLQRILKNVAWIVNDPIIVVGHNKEKIMEKIGPGFTYVIQEEQRGTGHAVQAVKDALKDRIFAKDAIVLLADHPFVSEQTMQNLWNAHKEKNAIITVTSLIVPDFLGDHELFSHYGKIRRDKNNRIQEIVEEKDANEEEKKIKEVNISFYCFDTKWLWENIGALKNENKAGEFYLTDMVQIAASQNIPIHSYALPLPNIKEGIGFNTWEQLELSRRLEDAT